MSTSQGSPRICHQKWRSQKVSSPEPLGDPGPETPWFGTSASRVVKEWASLGHFVMAAVRNWCSDLIHRLGGEINGDCIIKCLLSVNFPFLACSPGTGALNAFREGFDSLESSKVRAPGLEQSHSKCTSYIQLPAASPLPLSLQKRVQVRAGGRMFLLAQVLASLVGSLEMSRRKLLSWLSSPVMAEGPGAHPLPASSDRSVRQGMLAWWSPSPLQVLASRAAGVQDLGLPWWLRWLRICLQCKRPGFNPWVGKIPWRMEWQPTPVFKPGKSHGQRSLSGYSLPGRKEGDTTERLTFSHRSPQTPPPPQTDGS